MTLSHLSCFGRNALCTRLLGHQCHLALKQTQSCKTALSYLRLDCKPYVSLTTGNNADSLHSQSRKLLPPHESYAISKVRTLPQRRSLSLMGQASGSKFSTHTLTKCLSKNFRNSLQCTCSQAFTTSSMHLGTGIHISEEVREALHAGKAVVALESTIITHGMPYPENVQTALAVEQVVREYGAVPATVAVVQGKVQVGVTAGNVEWLGAQSTGLMKISRRDLPVALSQGLSGGTTVSGTMIAAHKAGIPVFATGGIGGVHRGGEDTMDVSADLRELGRTPVAVVAAGVKSILDIGRTLEYLETEGVCVVTYGPSTEFPAFFTPTSGHSAPCCVQDPEAAAAMIEACHVIQLNSGILFAVPIPEEFAASGELIENAIQEALQAAKISGIQGRDVTPFILKRVNELTKGASLLAIALVKNNAKVASQIAVALAEKRNHEREPATETLSGEVASPPLARSSCTAEKLKTKRTGQPVVVGGAVVDFCAKVKEDNIKMTGATYPGKIYQSFGGVGRNIADCLSRLGSAPLFISALGDDLHASALLGYSSHMDMSGVRQLPGYSTPTYCPVLTDSGHLMFGIGDMDVHSVFSPEMVSEFSTVLASAPLVCVDGNFSAAVIERVCQICSRNGVPVWFDPTDIHKATRLFQTDAWRHVTYISPNLAEIGCMWTHLTGCQEEPFLDTSPTETIKKGAEYCGELLKHIPVVMVTLGCHGLLLGQSQQDGRIKSLQHYPSTPPGGEPASLVSVSGAGDCLNSAMMRFIIQGYDLDLSVKAGLLAAQYSLQSHKAVPTSITPDAFTVETVQKWAQFDAVDISHML